MSPAAVLACAAVVLLAAALGSYFSTFREGYAADESAQSLLAQYDRAIAAQQSSPHSSAVPNPADGTSSAGSPAAAGAPGTPAGGAAVTLGGYDVIGKLDIAKIGLELPVLSQTTTKALKTSICYYEGAKPGEKGNMVITGHNYASGAHFGKLDLLKKGDTVAFDAPDGKQYAYEVLETEAVKPDNVQALNGGDGEYSLTLVTCTSSGNRRLLVRCRLIPNEPG